MHRVTLAVVAVTLLSCQATPDSATTTSSEPTTQERGTLVVTQHQRSCCYVDGQISFVRVSSGDIVEEAWAGPAGTRKVLARLALAPGTYTVESWQRPCSVSCPRLDDVGEPIDGTGLLDPATDDCASTVDVTPGSTVDVLVEFAPDAGCSIGVHADGLPSFVDGVLDCADDQIVRTEQPITGPDTPGSATPEDAMELALARWLGDRGELVASGLVGVAVVDGREVARATVAETPAGGWGLVLREYCR